MAGRDSRYPRLAEQLRGRPPGKGLSNTTSYISSVSISVRWIPRQNETNSSAPSCDQEKGKTMQKLTGKGNNTFGK